MEALLQDCSQALIETVFKKKRSKNNCLPYGIQSSISFTCFPAPFRESIKTVRLAPVNVLPTKNFGCLRELLNKFIDYL